MGCLVGWPGVGASDCVEIERQCARGRVVGRFGPHFRGAGLVIPQHELVEILVRYIRETAHELFDGGRCAVMTLEIQIHAFAELLRPDHGLEHPDDFGTFLVNRRRVEVVDLAIGIRADRMSEGAGILHKLHGAKPAHVGDTFHGTRALIR